MVGAGFLSPRSTRDAVQCRHARRKEAAIGRARCITHWNLLALLVMLLGVALTLGLDHLSLHQWAQSGVHIPVGEHFDVELPAGETLVYYESRENIVPDRIQLDVVAADGSRVRPRKLLEENNFRLLLTGWSGRSLWLIQLEEPATYQVRGFNADYLDDEQVPAEDRIVLFKQPPTLAAAVANRKLIQIVGGSITVTLALLLYLMHWRSLTRRASTRGAAAAPAEATDPRLDPTFAGKVDSLS